MALTRNKTLSLASSALLATLFALPAAADERAVVRGAAQNREDVRADAQLDQSLHITTHFEIEVLIGTWNCEAASFGLRVNAGFGSTNHIVDSQSGFNAMTGGALSADRFFPPPATLAQCKSVTDVVRGQLMGLGCTAEPAVLRDNGDDTGGAGFRFVCEGKATTMIHVIGEVHRSVLSMTP